jgi:hypothetical protein
MGTTGPQISEANRAHAQVLHERRELQNLDRALMRQIIEAIESLYLKPFALPYVGVLGKTTQQLPALLMGAYSYILPQELEMNHNKLALPYDATSEPFQILHDRFEEARTYSLDSNLLITDEQLINSGLVAPQNTGVLNRFIDLWTDKPAAEHVTWLAGIQTAF